MQNFNIDMKHFDELTLAHNSYAKIHVLYEYFSPVLASSLFYCNNNQGVIISCVVKNYNKHCIVCEIPCGALFPNSNKEIISFKKASRFSIVLSIIRFSGMPGIVVSSNVFRHCILWAKYRMTAI